MHHIALEGRSKTLYHDVNNSPRLKREAIILALRYFENLLRSQAQGSITLLLLITFDTEPKTHYQLQKYDFFLN